MEEDVKKILKSLSLLRVAMTATIDSLSGEQRSIVPAGLRNNIHWQAGHVVTVHASLLYRRCGQPLPIEERYFSFFGKGTSPADWYEAPPSLAEVEPQLTDLVELLSSDYANLRDRKYPGTITVSNGFQLSSFRDALAFLPMHDAIHLGAMNVMRRLLTSGG